MARPQKPHPEPKMHLGGKVLALPGVRPEDGDLAVVEFEDDTLTFKRIYIHGRQWLLVSVNPSYEPELRKVREIRQATKV